MKGILSTIAIIIAVSALVMQFFQVATRVENQSLENEISDLRREVVILRSEVGSPSSSPTSKETTASQVSVSTGGNENEAESQPQPSSHALRIAALEQQSADLEEIREALVRSSMLPPNEKEIAEAKSVVLDSSESVEKRIKALSTVRRSRTEQRSRDLVMAMVELLETNPMPKHQREIFKHLRGVKEPELLDHIRNALELNDSAFVREEATKALAGYTNDSMVQEWLQIIGTSDTNPNVRGEAMNLLERK